MSRFFRLFCIGATAVHRYHNTTVLYRQVCYIHVINLYFILFYYIADNCSTSCRESSNIPFQKTVVFFQQRVNSELPDLPQKKSPRALSLIDRFSCKFFQKITILLKLDRFARTAIEGVQVVRELFERGVRVHILNMGLVENTLTGNLILTVMLAFAEYERGMIVERTQTGNPQSPHEKPSPHAKRIRQRA